MTLSAGSIYSEAVDVEELQAQEGAQLPNLPKRFQQALTRGDAAFNGGFTDAGIRLGSLLKVRGACSKQTCKLRWVQPQAEPGTPNACAGNHPGCFALTSPRTAFLLSYARRGKFGALFFAHLHPCPVMVAPASSWQCSPTTSGAP